LQIEFPGEMSGLGCEEVVLMAERFTQGLDARFWCRLAQCVQSGELLFELALARQSVRVYIAEARKLTA